nr:glycogen debranching N-terminal domain-containing protein [Micromonospora sp. DSM 115978]
MAGNRVSILDGLSFLVCAGNGDVEESPVEPMGLFSFDTRFLSRWVLTVNGERLNALSVDDLQYYEARFFLVAGEPTHYVSSTLSVIRHRTIGAGFEERLTVINHSTEEVELVIRLDAASDFADLSEVEMPGLHKPGRYLRTATPGCLHLRYQRGTFTRETVIRSTEPARTDEDGMLFAVRIAAHQSWSTLLHVSTAIHTPSGTDLRGALHPHFKAARTTMADELEAWLADAPRLDCESKPLAHAYRQSLIDLAALRMPDLTAGGKMPAAGLPWYMTLVGRQSILTSYQALPYLPQLAATTLQVLALLQGAKTDDFRDEEPGKIIHQIRFGESAAFEERPDSQYYGAVDATPLFVVLLDEYERWTGDTTLVRQVEKEARAALAWLDEFGDLAGDGYLWYQRPNAPGGPENQCWKETAGAISYADGRLPGFPRATCELQGYAYDARMRGARLARKVWGDPAYADRLERAASDLREQFDRDFWITDRGYYALARGPDGDHVDALASNMGHLLWSGIVEPHRADDVVGHLLSGRLYSGWGVRTLAQGESRHNPLGYHTGTVWPYDNSFIAEGMRRYGYAQEAARLARSILDTLPYFRGRLPEAIAGYDRNLTRYPVAYRTANSPNGWSAGAPLMLLRTILGLQPHDEHLIVRATLPSGTGPIALLDIPGRWGRADALGRPR